LTTFSRSSIGNGFMAAINILILIVLYLLAIGCMCAEYASKR